MAVTNFETLPDELIKQIATSSDATTTLSLARTCRHFRAACLDDLIFRQILENAQTGLWRNSSLDLEAVSERCQTNAHLWARYAVADQKAFSASRDSAGQDQNLISWLPELLVVKHPVMYEEFCPVPSSQPDVNSDTRQMFCFAMAQLAQDSSDLKPTSELTSYLENTFDVPVEETTAGYIRAMCNTLWAARRMLATRRSVWPFNHLAMVPDVSLPGPPNLALRPAASDYQLPLPLGQGLENGAWQKWYAKHVLTRVKSSDIFEGQWTGYYTYGGSFLNDQLDPPMVDIQFVRRRVDPIVLRTYGDPDREVLESIAAENCQDGVGSFKIEGAIQRWGDRCVFRGRKGYYDPHSVDGLGIIWEWRLEVTPFGLIGYWGDMHMQGGYPQKGAVWLWKR